MDTLLEVASLIFRSMLRLLAQLVLHLLGYTTAKLILPLLSCGRVHVGGGPLHTGRWYGRTPRGLVVQGDLAAFLGLMFWIILFFLLVATSRWWAP